MAVRNAHETQETALNHLWQSVSKIDPEIERHPEAKQGFEIPIQAKREQASPRTISEKLIYARQWIRGASTPQHLHDPLIELAENIAQLKF